MDAADYAQEYNELFLSVALENHRNRHDGMSSVECEDCGEEIPEARHRAVPGCTRCVICQQKIGR